MSKQKTLETETEKVTTENPVAQNELEGMEVTESKETVAEVIPESSPKKSGIKINKVATASVKSNKKMYVSKFLSLYPQDIYISTLLKFYYPKSFFTVEQWFQRIEEILNTPINN